MTTAPSSNSNSIHGVVTVLLIANCLVHVGCDGSADQARSQSTPPETTPESEVVYRAPDGRSVSLDHLADSGGEFSWELVGSTHVTQAARLLHQNGRQAASAGKYDEALQFFGDASLQAPDWPYPVYDAAFANLLRGNDVEALRLYQRTLRLSPRGFFTAITAVHYLALEASGNLPRGVYLHFVSFEWLDPIARAGAAKLLTERVPSFAPGWKERAQSETNPSTKLAFIDRGIQSSPDKETLGYLLLNKATLLEAQGKSMAALRILGDLALDDKGPKDVQHNALSTMALIQRSSARD